ncbi:(d)CMP kinase [Candidatus Pantoea edessiphila]|uniref:Cytidylate kinase n=1 Tax=Candidatus Pantoea edessiphila TaxID=2044610 RepID=A0A2P5SYW1_9GAMM|nr:(d)CMP kinase [Candidatus Pantoea edessiphila]MBK4775327.1 (d)CMP kinase [Pantoea sp. Edef]PPI87537.1 (d)CMP kinase [Candidatus Pantoea edessiphila]
MLVIPVITIDGPSGVGKSTLCKAIGRLLKWNILNSGAIYRSLALICIEQKINVLQLERSIKHILIDFNLNFVYKNNKFIVFLDNRDISQIIRKQEVSELSSYIAEKPLIRNALLQKQRDFLKTPGLIADGRDMGTIIFPDAKVKIFLNASLEERTKRRKLQLKKQGFSVNFEKLFNQIKDRDERDYNRKISPLLPASDALIINSEHISFKQVLNNTLQYAQEKYLIIKDNNLYQGLGIGNVKQHHKT